VDAFGLEGRQVGRSTVRHGFIRDDTVAASGDPPLFFGPAEPCCGQ